jgi:hypothetical protein
VPVLLERSNATSTLWSFEIAVILGAVELAQRQAMMMLSPGWRDTSQEAGWSHNS